MVMGCLVFGTATAFMGLTPTFSVYLGLMVVAGLTMPTFQSPMMSLMQERVPVDMIGRVFSLMQICSSFVFMIAAMTVGLLSDNVPIGVVLSLSGVLLALVGITMLLDKQFFIYGKPVSQTA